ncbi:DUF411 domain-containing protein [Ideonella sp. B7]|uniref:DUF411 domain-containing protein n=1 Tax=Ideonella benzenivorans TaxID=2831643 RepID=UPI001CED5C26|nr:DUF411 domain-containing protein [Ideonella benzenivorans]MCA6215637.1 DUF411 domain-containing protein [Ideonella benzenivorans]
MKRRQLLRLTLGGAILPVLAVHSARAAAALPSVEVFKSPYCGCCGAWADHMKAAGFAVKVTLVEDTSAMRRRVGLPDRFASCHTALVAGYAVEGHVPADEVKRLLALRPRAIGLAVPSMPPGSPGMEMGNRHDPYQVFLINQQGRETVFASYPKAQA